MLPYVLLGLVLLALGWAVTRVINRGPSREAVMYKLNAEPGSSYAQKTNHLQSGPVEMGPIAGFESPFRVNMYQAYIE